MYIPFVNVREFTPNTRINWVPVGTIGSVQRSGDRFTLALDGSAGLTVELSFLSATCFRVRFDPTRPTAQAPDVSPAVVAASLGPVSLSVVEESATALVIDTGAMVVQVDLRPYRLRVYRGGQLVSADPDGFNLVYIPGQQVIANFKTMPPGALYCGFGEKAGAQVLKNHFTMTQFNFDNFSYTQAPLPPDNEPGPLNPSEALYASIPLLIEMNPQPSGDYAGAPFACGIFFDNISQSYFNIATNDYSDMTGLYYYGALFGTMNYYFFLGDGAPDVLEQYTALTGRGPMPPKYVFGYHQGCYGYFDRATLESVADAFRQARIPCDGLHIDVDFQDNYRTFTHSEKKFPDARGMLDGLRANGFKCSTNVTPLLTDNRLDENGAYATYSQRDALLSAGGLIYATYAGQGPNPGLFQGRISYGMCNRSNPYQYEPHNAYPPLTPNQDGAVPLNATGNYCDYGRADVRRLWGDQYEHLVRDLGMDMIWQDMMDPAQDRAVAGNILTFPLNLMMNDGAAYVPHGYMHNAYAQYLLEGTWEGLKRLRPDRRNFIIARGGYAGMQRYAALWTGDSASSWDFLRINIPEVLNIGLSGVPISGCDIGGFANGSGSVGDVVYPSQVGGAVQGGVTNYELLTRWMQVGAFLPWFRNHYNGYTKAFQEPYAYGEPVPANCRKVVELRYRLLQLFYDAMYEWTQTGMPIARALFLNDPGDPGVYSRLDDQFFVGRDLLVAPVLGQFDSLSPPQVPRRDIYLPAGSDWYAFRDDAPLDAPIAGGTTLRDVVAGLDTVPLYVRAGGILPLRRHVEQYVGERAQNPLVLTCYPGPDREYRLYQDDGITTGAETAGLYRTTRVTQQTVDASRTVRLQRLHDGYSPPEPYVLVALPGSIRPARVEVQGEAVPDAGSLDSLERSSVAGYVTDGATGTVYVKLPDTDADATVVVTV
ncbi:TIM-barrel domain-containing protein [Azospirillum halopraeferens]|uniref:TIM-barrel domain-containing protein n=1 Tax=Azospirillum halopraeferens TaxID=34010 RepID=UPI000423E16A|nr:TIM-barrel domain-containing protein [Azospirillum halopraeferens]